ncbi:MAG: DUF2460 domain-containing protein [Actinomycetia bacterium]|nr:DUF2460 domain-containing protein [Actinomycetes bacterium]
MALKHGVTSSTASRIVLGPGALYANWQNGTGTLLGATVGGGSFTITRSKYSVKPDGAKGKVKGLDFIGEVSATLTANLVEATVANLVKFGLAFNQSSFASGNTIGTGTGSLTTFALASTPDNVVAPKIFVAGVEKSLTTDYSISGTTVTFVTAPASDAVITADYSYAASATSGDFYMLRGDTTVAAADYLTNLALLLEYTGDSTDPMVLVIKNPTTNGEFALNLPTGQEEVIFPITWEAAFDSSSLTVEPWEILIPEPAS